MATEFREVDLSGIRDRQRPVAFVAVLVLVTLGVAGLTGVLDAGNPAVVVGVFGIPLWLGVTGVVAGLLGIALSFYAGGSTTFDKLAAGLVLPAVLLLAVVDWLVAGGLDPLSGIVGLLALVLAVALVAVGTVLLYGNPLSVVLPVVAVLAIADWALGLTAMTPGDPVTPATLALLAVLAVALGLVGFEGGRRQT